MEEIALAGTSGAINVKPPLLTHCGDAAKKPRTMAGQ